MQVRKKFNHRFVRCNVCCYNCQQPKWLHACKGIPWWYASSAHSFHMGNYRSTVQQSRDVVCRPLAVGTRPRRQMDSPEMGTGLPQSPLHVQVTQSMSETGWHELHTTRLQVKFSRVPCTFLKHKNGSLMIYIDKKNPKRVNFNSMATHRLTLWMGQSSGMSTKTAFFQNLQNLDKLIMLYIARKVLRFAAILWMLKCSISNGVREISKSIFSQNFDSPLWPWLWVNVILSCMFLKVLPQTTYSPSGIALLSKICDILSY